VLPLCGLSQSCDLPYLLRARLRGGQHGGTRRLGEKREHRLLGPEHLLTRPCVQRRHLLLPTVVRVRVSAWSCLATDGGVSQNTAVSCVSEHPALARPLTRTSPGEKVEFGVIANPASPVLPARPWFPASIRRHPPCLSGVSSLLPNPNGVPSAWFVIFVQSRRRAGQ
jgi:hypothetical protein